MIQYVRVAAETDMDIMTRLLLEVWKLPPPQLVVSVIGGAPEDAKLAATIRAFLIKVLENKGIGLYNTFACEMFTIIMF
jgi:hypothetical protein